MSPSRECICCLSRKSTPHLKGLRRCLRCSHVWADLDIPEKEFRKIYSRKYYEGEEYLDYGKEREALRRNFRARIRDLSRRHPRGARLFEIGCAYGYFLEMARDFFEVSGCDISSHAANFARDKLGLEVSDREYLTLPSPERPFDMICLWDTVEHLKDPRLYLEKASREMKKGGTLALSTGDIGSFAAKIRGAKWRLIHPPTHLHYFTRKSIRTLLERLGFGEIRIFHPPFWRSADAMASAVLSYPSGRWTDRIYRALRATHLLKLEIPLNTWDLMTVYARKNG